MALKRVRLELARNEEFPDGSPNHGYEVTLPITDDDRFDVAGWESDGQLCTMVKFTAEDDDQHGQLVRTDGGQWAFSYELGDADDEPIFRLESHVFRPNEYVTVSDAEGGQHVFRVISVENPRFPAPE